MNTKAAKALRKEIGYHPSQPRKYMHTGQGIELDPSDKRALYQEMKKERKAGVA